MSIKIRRCFFRVLLLASFVLMGAAGTSGAAEYWLSAEVLIKTMPDAQAITMWGFAQCTANFGSCSPATVPGPEIIVPPGDNILTVNLRNNLTGPYVEPVSLVIPGQFTTTTPVWINHTTGAVVSIGSRPAGDVTSRMRSLTHETAPGAIGVYTWNNVKPGTYLYRSGTHQAVQIQMGLYGLMKKDAGLSQAYSPTAQNPNTTYQSQWTLLFSEIDPALHAPIAAGTYGPNPPIPRPAGWLTSTIDFAPKYFLINGTPFSIGLAPVLAGRSGEPLLLRFLNAGLRDYIPLIQGLHLNIIAEDGILLPYGKRQYSLLLPAGKTIDVLVTPTAGDFPVYDRRLNLTNNLATPGGMLTFLRITLTTQDLIQNLLTKYYNDILGRAPDPGGLAFWTAEINASLAIGVDIKEAFITVAKFLFNSSEYFARGRTDTEYVGDLFQTFFNRAPTLDETTTWVTYIGNANRNLALLNFALGPEFMAYLNSVIGPVTERPENNLVNDFYRGLLWRLPDAGGFTFWLDLMRTAQCTGAQQVTDVSYLVAWLFANSPEYLARGRDNAGYLEDLYDAVMRRSADLGGLNFWLGVLNGGIMSRDQVLQFFTASPEFQSRVQQVISAGCLP